MTPYQIAQWLDWRGKLEVYNIGQREHAYRASATNHKRQILIAALLARRVIIEMTDVNKAYALTEFGRKVFDEVKFDAELTIAQIRQSRLGGHRPNQRYNSRG